jgi:hypothetical protein
MMEFLSDLFSSQSNSRNTTMRLAFTVIFASASHDTLENTHEDHPASSTSILA